MSTSSAVSTGAVVQARRVEMLSRRIFHGASRRWARRVRSWARKGEDLGCLHVSSRPDERVVSGVSVVQCVAEGICEH